MMTKRLELSFLTEEDAPFILELLNSEGWIKYIGDRGVNTLGDAKEYVNSGPQKSYKQHGYGLMLITKKETDEKIGICGLLKRDYLDSPDIGFALLPQYQGKGLMKEACLNRLSWAKEKNLTCIQAICDPKNERSIGLLGKLGFSFISKMVRDQETISLYQINL